MDVQLTAQLTTKLTTRLLNFTALQTLSNQSQWLVSVNNQLLIKDSCKSNIILRLGSSMPEPPHTAECQSGKTQHVQPSPKPRPTGHKTLKICFSLSLKHRHPAQSIHDFPRNEVEVEPCRNQLGSILQPQASFTRVTMLGVWPPLAV